MQNINLENSEDVQEMQMNENVSHENSFLNLDSVVWLIISFLSLSFIKKATCNKMQMKWLLINLIHCKYLSTYWSKGIIPVSAPALDQTGVEYFSGAATAQL